MSQLTLAESEGTSVPLLAPAKAVASDLSFTSVQESCIKEVRSLIPAIVNAVDEKCPLPKDDSARSKADKEDQERFLTDGCFFRYLKATKWNVKATASRLENTLIWRRTYRPYAIHPDDVVSESLTGKQVLSGFNKQGRPILYLIPSKENSNDAEMNLKYVVFNLEGAVRLMPPGIEQMVIIIDFEGVGMMNCPSVAATRKVYQILSDHYPERLGTAFFVNPSWYFWVFFRIVSPFMDPETKAKIHFYSTQKAIASSKSEKAGDETAEATTGGWENILKYIDADQLDAAYGGSRKFVFDHPEYWKHVSAIFADA
ncbi:hypothetical protein HDU96_008078 [Phlyctochytrium bullatum]|nr:hypothetical protein HDU96_008078 [Phlyctochytrium bullatum]